ncbi:siroheme synthase CysG [Photobacterium damselae]|uniref:siroheme synthase CysG n=1 Tax=Photobacterium damselae TaxID=38293 RepID=UPI00165E260D|nr:siroheme synthase CysG [Photobacterium damselae]
MEYLPIFADINRRPCLVVGGGEVAWRKTQMLLQAGANVHLVAKSVSPEIQAAITNQQVVLLADSFAPELLNGMFLAIAATDSKAVNALVYQAANQRQILVNVVDDTQRCSFIVPSIIDRSPIVIAISSAGKASVLARLVREKLEALLPQHLGKMAQVAGEFRAQLKQVLPSFSARRHFWEQAFRGRFAQLIASNNIEQAKAELITLSHQSNPVGHVSLVGAGPGDPDLLTLKALQQMQQADVVLYDQLVSPQILELVRRDAQLVSVGKKAGCHSVPQKQTNQLLVEFALQGKKVVRLKGGDPFIFGRGGEELEVLVEHGIEFDVVPGITAAAGATSYAGIPLTHRDYAQSAMFITGHLKQEQDDLDWSTLARGRQTLVIYMGLLKSSYIQQQLLAYGRPSHTPIAIIERGTQAEQKVLVGQLSQLSELAKQAQSPSLIVIGEVVALQSKLQWFNQIQSQPSSAAVVNLV